MSQTAVKTLDRFVAFYVLQNHLSLTRTSDCEHHWLLLLTATSLKSTQANGSKFLVLFSALSWCLIYTPRHQKQDNVYLTAMMKLPLLICKYLFSIYQFTAIRNRASEDSCLFRDVSPSGITVHYSCFSYFVLD